MSTTYWVATDAHMPGCLPTDGGVSVHMSVADAWQYLSDLVLFPADCMCTRDDRERVVSKCGDCVDAERLRRRAAGRWAATPGTVEAAEGIAIYTVERLDIDRDELIDAATETVLWMQCLQARPELSPDPLDGPLRVDMSTTSRRPGGGVRERMRRADRDDVRAAVAGWVDEWVSAVDVEDLRTAVRKRGVARIGHSLVLSAAGYAAGFWDEGLGDVGTRLAAEAHRIIGDVTVWVSPRGPGGWRRVEGIDR